MIPHPDTLRAAVEQALAAVPYPTHPAGLYEPISYVLGGGGKRLRPTLLLLCYSLLRDDWQQALPAAVGIETYHNHTLLHDDLMDRADVRRGRPTVHRRWDENTAILSGDTMLIMAMRHVMRCPLPTAGAALSLLAAQAQAVCEGQQMDMNFERRAAVTEPEYVEMIRLKTGALLSCAAGMGALLAGAGEEQAAALGRFAETVGLAFQIQDDYLDVWGDAAVFGKAIGGDILCGKKTFPLIAAQRLATDEQRCQLGALLADTAMEPEAKIAAVTALYDELGAGAYTQQAVVRYYDEARRILSGAGLADEGAEALWRYALSLLQRQS